MRDTGQADVDSVCLVSLVPWRFDIRLGAVPEYVV
jgi:hypothetical protein